MTRKEVAKIVFPGFWTPEQSKKVKKMLLNEDWPLEQMARVCINRYSGKRDGCVDLKARLVARDEHNTLVVSIDGGRNGSISKNAPYYFAQWSAMLQEARMHGIRMWPINVDFDCLDDVYTASFGVAFNIDEPAYLLRMAEELEEMSN